MSDPIISVEHLGKKYLIDHQAQRQRYTALRDILTEKAKRLIPFRRSRQESNGHRRTEKFWALEDVSFEINQGEVVGIIGRNGAGKSTLLKILSRITEPTVGRVRLRGRVASLLEVGTGFHPELTGRENTYLNGAILGMTRAEIRKKFDEIVAFAEVEKFLDTPVKHYSSGMYVRLAFAVAAHLEPEILVVDEVLAVGDTEFQKKCLGKMGDMSRGGRTVLFVSHNMAAIRTLCSRAIILDRGRLTGDNRVGEAIDIYLRTGGSSATSTWERPKSEDDIAPVFFRAIEAHLAGSQPKLSLAVTGHVVCKEKSFPKMLVAVDLCDAVGTALMQASPVPEPFIELKEGEYQLTIEIALPPMIPGRYTLDVWLGTHHTATVDYIRNAVAIDIHDSPTIGRSFPHYSNHGHMVPDSRCKYERSPKLPVTFQ